MGDCDIALKRCVPLHVVAEAVCDAGRDLVPKHQHAPIEVRPVLMLVREDQIPTFGDKLLCTLPAHVETMVGLYSKVVVIVGVEEKCLTRCAQCPIQLQIEQVLVRHVWNGPYILADVGQPHLVVNEVDPCIEPGDEKVGEHVQG